MEWIANGVDIGVRNRQDAALKRAVLLVLWMVGFELISNCTKPGTGPDDIFVPETIYTIAFVSNRDDHDRFQIYTMQSDGSVQRRVTQDSKRYYHPRFMPDGNRIVFYSHSQDGNDDIYAVNTDGTGFANLSIAQGNDDFPQISPDGSKIVFTSDRDGNREIYVMNADGSGQQRLTHNTTLDHAPQFSPDGSRIVYFSLDTQWRYDVHTIGIDGSNPACLTYEFDYAHLPGSPENSHFEAYFFGPHYSPDGRFIVFASYSFTERNVDIFRMDADGSNPQRLTDVPGYNFHPRFTLDMVSILFMTHRWDNYDIFSMNPDGSGQNPLYNSRTGHAVLSDIAYDGKKVAFMDDKVIAGIYKIFIMDTDGQNVLQLTNGEYEDYFPRFQPML